MNQQGISIEVACAERAANDEGFLSDQSFEKMCNEDGSVKTQPKTTTFTLKDNDLVSVTINHTYAYISIAVFMLIVLAIAIAAIRSTNKKHRK